MVTSDEERQGGEAQDSAPGVAPVSAPQTPPDEQDLRPNAEGADEALLQGGLTQLEADAMTAEGAVPLTTPHSLGDPAANEAGAAIAEPVHQGELEAAAEGSVTVDGPPMNPSASDPAAGGELSEDEATGRRVESLLEEAPDAHPEGSLPVRGALAPLVFEAAPVFDDPDEPPPPPSTSAFRDSVLKRSGMDRMGPIVAFDFDGTLTVRDSFTAFLKWREGSARYHAEMAALAPAALKYLFDRDPGKLKAAAVRRFLQGLPRSVLNEEAMEFATVSAPLLFRPDALKAWRRYRQDGARLLIVTASPENIVAPFARGLGADMLIATQLLFDEEDRVKGGLLGDNCRGPEKVRRIKRALGEDVGLAAAYGDTDGDWEMLGMAEQQFMRLFVGVPGKPTSAG